MRLKRSFFRRNSFINSFRCALNGLRFTIYSQTNMWIHLAGTTLAIGLGFYFRLNAGEWLALMTSIFLVLMAESFNTAVEVSIDLVTRKTKYRAMLAKDIAAGAVLLSALNAVIVGYLLFFARLVKLFHT